MVFNKLMQRYIHAITVENIAPQPEYPIWRKLNKLGPPYWGAGGFCGIGTTFVNGDRDLTQLEWDETRLISVIPMRF